jgi:hypothetical protein
MLEGQISTLSSSILIKYKKQLSVFLKLRCKNLSKLNCQKKVCEERRYKKDRKDALNKNRLWKRRKRNRVRITH